MKSYYDMTDEELIENFNVTFVGKKAVCPKCKGEKFQSKIGPFTGDDMDEWYGDNWEERDEFLENYQTRGGIYDERCATCKGEGVIDLEGLKTYAYNLEAEYEQRMEDRYAYGYGY